MTNESLASPRTPEKGNSHKALLVESKVVRNSTRILPSSRLFKSNRPPPRIRLIPNSLRTDPPQSQTGSEVTYARETVVVAVNSKQARATFAEKKERKHSQLEDIRGALQKITQE
mmetsp:Transcript_19841/g.48550  ORF Transcript_19841/g.48550 Transcript_19841/m.48550 type:complete len:115 (-) Transcript_19841:54-398(-)